MVAKTEKTIEKQRATFLDALSQSANVTRSAKRAGIARCVAYQWRDADEEFRKAWDAALELGIDALEDEATRRAAEGVVKPVFYQGVKCGSVREYSDTLMMFMLKARRPDRFKDRAATELTGAEGGSIVIERRIVDAKP